MKCGFLGQLLFLALLLVIFFKQLVLDLIQEKRYSFVTVQVIVYAIYGC